MEGMDLRIVWRRIHSIAGLAGSDDARLHGRDHETCGIGGGVRRGDLEERSFNAGVCAGKCDQFDAGRIFCGEDRGNGIFPFAQSGI